jgi:hypothetical protein
MNKRKYAQLRKANICTSCGSNKAAKDRAKCLICIEKDRIYQARQREYKKDNITIIRVKKNNRSQFIKFLNKKSDFDLLEINKLNAVFSYNGTQKDAEFYLKAYKILYKNLKDRLRRKERKINKCHLKNINFM